MTPSATPPARKARRRPKPPVVTEPRDVRELGAIVVHQATHDDDGKIIGGIVGIVTALHDNGQVSVALFSGLHQLPVRLPIEQLVRAWRYSLGRSGTRATQAPLSQKRPCSTPERMHNPRPASQAHGTPPLA